MEVESPECLLEPTQYVEDGSPQPVIPRRIEGIPLQRRPHLPQSCFRIAGESMYVARSSQDIGVIRIDRQCPSHVVEGSIMLLDLNGGLAERPVTKLVHRIEGDCRFSALHSLQSP